MKCSNHGGSTKFNKIGVRDKANQLIGWFDDELEAKSFIKRNDSKGTKGLHVITP